VARVQFCCFGLEDGTSWRESVCGALEQQCHTLHFATVGRSDSVRSNWRRKLENIFRKGAKPQRI